VNRIGKEFQISDKFDDDQEVCVRLPKVLDAHSRECAEMYLTASEVNTLCYHLKDLLSGVSHVI